jgi:hypothetical protein
MGSIMSDASIYIIALIILAALACWICITRVK